MAVREDAPWSLRMVGWLGCYILGGPQPVAFDEVLTMTTTLTEVFGEPVYSYSRAEAIEDGALIDLTAVAVKAGLQSPIRYPIACTSAVWGWIEPSEAEIALGQSVAGRLWDVLWMLSLAVRRNPTASEALFVVVFLRCPERGRYKHHHVQLRAVCGPGDDEAPVMTIMMPDED